MASEHPAAQVLARPRLLYFADTMCSWCYGFAPEMNAVLAALGDRVEMLLFSGGLRPFTTEPVADKMRGFFAETYARIAGITGQDFTDPRSLKPGFIYDTEPASRAVVTVRALVPGKAYPFMLAIQRAFYSAGADITKADVLADHAETFGIARNAFLSSFDSEEMRQATLADFQVAQRFGIDGFPTLVLHRQDAGGKDELILLGKGYSEAAALIERLEAALAGAPAA